MEVVLRICYNIPPLEDCMELVQCTLVSTGTGVIKSAPNDLYI